MFVLIKHQLRQEKQGKDTAVSEAVEAREAEINSTWSDKLNKAVASAEQRWQTQYKTLEEDYQVLEKNLNTLKACE